jgi:hypothetical protein
MFALSPKARRQARIAGLVCAAYGTAMFATHAYVTAHQSHRVAPVVFKHPVTPVPRKRSPKQEGAKTSQAWGTAAESPVSAVSASEQTQPAVSSPAPGPPGDGPAVVATQPIPPVIVPGGGTTSNSQGFVPAIAPGMVQGFRPGYRGPASAGQQPPNYPNSHGNHPPPPMPRGAQRAAGGNHPPTPPPRHK